MNCPIDEEWNDGFEGTDIKPRDDYDEEEDQE
jgi:hypothetical protein